MERSVFSREGLREALKSACFELASVGVTCVHPCGADDYGMEEDLSLYDELRRRGELPVRVFTYHDALPYPVMPSGFGGEWIRYQGLKIFLDGSLGGRTAALTAPYADEPAQTGRLNWTDEQVLGMLRAARGKGIQTLLHAIGDRALDQALDCIGKVDEEFGPAALKDRVNHLIVCRPEQRRRLAELGLFCDIQPSFIPSDIAMAPLRLGPERMAWTYRWRSILNECGPLSASSDAPVESVNPMHSLWALVERRGKDGEAPLSRRAADRRRGASALHVEPVQSGRQKRRRTPRSGVSGRRRCARQGSARPLGGRPILRRRALHHRGRARDARRNGGVDTRTHGRDAVQLS